MLISYKKQQRIVLISEITAMAALIDSVGTKLGC